MIIFVVRDTKLYTASQFQAISLCSHYHHVFFYKYKFIMDIIKDSDLLFIFSYLNIEKIVSITGLAYAVSIQHSMSLRNLGN